MNYKRLLVLTLLLILFTIPASATMVSFLVVETGLGDGGPNPQHSSLWEGALMASFFDAGYIVTNGPIARMERKPAQDLSGIVKIDFDEAVDGGAEFFVLAFLNYQIQGGATVPVEIAIKVYKTDSSQLFFEQSFPAGRGRTLNEENQNALQAGRAIVRRMGNG
jgi:hypothetical protein